MRRKFALAVGSLMSVPTIAAAGPSISWSADPLLVSAAECVRLGDAALRKVGFENIVVSEDNAFGVFGDYSATVVCIGESETVFIVVAGPMVKKTAEYKRAIKREAGF